jgi:predicted nucleic acid-binding Zn ribbon protein
MSDEKKCLECGNPVFGRVDKKFCSDGCRNVFNNKTKASASNYMRNVNNILSKNRRILKAMNPEGKIKKHKDQMMKKGFDFDFVTNTYTTKAGDTYRFVYEQGYLMLDEGFVLLVERNEEG